MSCGFGGHTAYEIFRDLGGFIGSIIALIAAALAYRATKQASSDQLAAQRTREEKEAANVREAVQIEITTLVTGMVNAANVLGPASRDGRDPTLRTPDMLGRWLGTPTIYPQVADHIGLLDDPYSVVLFYSHLAQARSFGTDWRQALPYIQTALLLARPILAGEIFGGERLDLKRREQTILAIDTCLREIFGIGGQGS
jgi:hypothetical protein